MPAGAEAFRFVPRRRCHVAQNILNSKSPIGREMTSGDPSNSPDGDPCALVEEAV